MKNIYSCLLILTFFASCNNDLDTVKEGAATTIGHRTISETLPLNTSNPYDYVGQLHDELFESYYASGNLPTSVSGIANRVEAIANENTQFNAIKSSTYHAVSSERLQYILDHKSTYLTDVITASSMTAKAKLSLSTFINSLVVVFDTETNCDVLYQFVADYETEIIGDPLLTEKDKQIMLTTTSIGRHSAYLAKKKPKKNTDPDWTILIVNVVAAADGAEFGKAEAITLALAAGIATN